MAKLTRIDASTYYDTLPTINHECGDIWRGLPSFGLLGGSTCSGIIITPACDLSWQKSETVTYLPIISIRSYFSSDAALPLILEKIDSALKQLPFPFELGWSGDSYIVPPEHEMTIVEKQVSDFRDEQQRSAKILSAIDRVLNAIAILRLIRESDIVDVDASMLALAFGNEWVRVREKIVTNSFSPATHFLPADRQAPVFSAIPAHSVALFRHPITVPVKVLNHALESSDGAWRGRLEDIELAPVLRTSFQDTRPIKMASLQANVLSDLLTRFSALYNRVGSPDFSKQTISLYVQEIDE